MVVLAKLLPPQFAESQAVPCHKTGAIPHRQGGCKQLIWSSKAVQHYGYRLIHTDWLQGQRATPEVLNLLVQEVRLQQQEKRQRMFLPKKKTNSSGGCCDLQPHLPYHPAPLARQQAPTWQWVCHPPLLHREQQDQLSCCHSSRLQVSSENLPHSRCWVFSGQPLHFSDLHSKEKSVPPKEGREQSGSSFFWYK